MRLLQEHDDSISGTDQKIMIEYDIPYEKGALDFRLATKRRMTAMVASTVIAIIEP